MKHAAVFLLAATAVVATTPPRLAAPYVLFRVEKSSKRSPSYASPKSSKVGKADSKCVQSPPLLASYSMSLSSAGHMMSTNFSSSTEGPDQGKTTGKSGKSGARAGSSSRSRSAAKAGKSGRGLRDGRRDSTVAPKTSKSKASKCVEAPSASPSVSPAPINQQVHSTVAFKTSKSKSASKTSKSKSGPSDPSLRPSVSAAPSGQPSTVPALSASPTSPPSMSPSTPLPTGMPSFQPSDLPSVSSAPSNQPSLRPSASAAPSGQPSIVPTISANPTSPPSVNPSTPLPTGVPSLQPSDLPSVSSAPSSNPSLRPSVSAAPSSPPSPRPSTSVSPSNHPSPAPSLSTRPTQKPSDQPSVSGHPSSEPSTPPPVQMLLCTSDPRFKDDIGRTCKYYVATNALQGCGDEDNPPPGWTNTESGQTPWDACCYCGGGTITLAPTEPVGADTLSNDDGSAKDLVIGPTTPAPTPAPSPKPTPEPTPERTALVLAQTALPTSSSPTSGSTTTVGTWNTVPPTVANARVACLVEQDCEIAALNLGLAPFYAAADYATKGCYRKHGKAFFSPGTVAEMAAHDLPGVQERVYCPGT